MIEIITLAVICERRKMESNTMKTELQKQLHEAEIEKLRIIDRVKEIKAQIEEAEKEPSIFELMPIGSVWCGWEVSGHDHHSSIFPVEVEDRIFEHKIFPGRDNLNKLIAEQRKLDAMKRFAQAASDYCKTHIFNNETLYDAFVEYNLVVEQEAK
jgi:hypothetical protein